MGMVIRNNLDSVRAYNIYNKNAMALSHTMYQVSSGQRINSAADGPSDLAISEKMRERINSLNQASQNIQNDTALAKTAGDGIANTVEILRSLKAKVIQGSDAATNETDRGIIVKEITALLAQVDSNATNIQYNGKKLLDGSFTNESTSAAAGSTDADSKSTFVFQVGEASGMTVQLQIVNLTKKGLALETGVTLSQIKSSNKAKTIIDKIDAALTKALGAATDVGSVQNRLGYTADNVNTQIENLQASDSAIRDADMAKEISDYLKWNVLSQASQYMLAQSNQNAFSVLNLLQ